MHLKQSIAILKLILNLIGSQWRRINDDVTCSCLGNEHINRTDAFCTRWSLLRSVAATIMIGYCNSLFWTIDFSSISSKLRNLLIRPILCRWYKHRITMREIDFANHRKVIYPMPFLVGRSPPIWKIGRGNNRDCDITMPPSLKTMEVQIKGDQRNKRFRTVQVNRGFSPQFWTTGTGSRSIFTLWRWSYERSVPFLCKFIETRELTVTTGNRCSVHAQRYSRKVLTLQIIVIVNN